MANPTRLLSYLLFTVGVTVAIIGGAKLPEAGPPADLQTDDVAAEEEIAGQFPDTVPIFLAGVAASIVGLVLWRIDLRKEQRDAHDDDEIPDHRNPVALLRDVVAPSQELLQEIDRLDRAAVMRRVNDLLEQYILPFAEVRQGIIHKFGMTDGAEILVTTAYGERMLNRTWSAAADGHLPEAIASFPEAVDAFELAAKQLDQAVTSARTDNQDGY